MPSSVRTFLQKRLFSELQGAKLINHPIPEFLRVCRSWAGTSGAQRWFSIERINQMFDMAVARALKASGATAVYGYFDTSLHTFREAKRLGLRTIYELPTPYWRTTKRFVTIARDSRPDWADTLPSPEEFAESWPRRDEELRLADLVIVPSDFVKDSLAEAPSIIAPVEVVPYGCPEVAERDYYAPREGTPLRLLFAGRVSQSKGLADLLEAIAPLGGQIELSVAGDFAGVGQVAQIIGQPQVRFLGRLPHASLLEVMQRQDLCVLPTWYEGLSLVLLEAMSQGMPVLTTVNSGLEGLIEEGRQGWLVPVGSPLAIRERLEKILSEPSSLLSNSVEASEWARRHSWGIYRQRLQHALNARL
ncbi:MAG: glycosyltransferase family 4 protein [Verrucomicrobia bacterium]|nr:glycosyltransferase family 4 protein [Verrucomicrobiota bacterium]